MSDYDDRPTSLQSVEITEHRLVDGINAKAVFPYTTPLATEVDTSSTASVIYVGQAAMGSDTSDPMWQIQAINTSNGVKITWANSNSAYSNIWDNRTSITYG